VTDRQVLVIDAEGSVRAQLQASAAQGPGYFFSNSTSQAGQLLSQRRFGAVLVVFDPQFPLKQDEVEHLMSSPCSGEWIALVQPCMLQSREFQTFVLRSFHDYHTLPLDPERLALSIGHACGRAKIRMALADKADYSHRFEMTATSQVMKSFIQRLERVVQTDAPVLIEGETGTGKEVVAKAIHKHSKRSNGPLVVVNCGAVSASLIQSELFGHEKGAFTGATQRHIGKIESASGGVLFLDEIGDLPLEMQVSLLRVLQERTISRLGSVQTIAVDFRVIAATHVNLQDAVAQGRFREDLFYRLNVIRLEIPPLRKRTGDISLLAEAVFRKYVKLCGNNQVRGFSKEALKAMNAHDWPGNVRELINRVQRAMTMTESRLLSAADLGLDAHSKQTSTVRLDVARTSFDRHMLETSLRNNGHKVAQTARQLGVSRVTLYRMMNKLNIAPASLSKGDGSAIPAAQLLN
jgi:DNA-binding NtrC family response regulator